MKKILLIFLLATFTVNSNINSQTFTYDFTTGYDNWFGDFADYPITDSVLCELEFARTALPSPLNTSKFALKISGKNYPDDLFMFIKRKISGLMPNTTYKLLMDIEFASNTPTNAAGVGGQPGEGVIVKVGASVVEPIKFISGSFYRMNIDKGQQTAPGEDMDTIGHVGVSDTTTVFTLINRNNSTHLFTITTDSNGEVWVCIGTDSGYESTTTLYYNFISLTFTNIMGINDFNEPKNFKIYPNPTNEFISVSIESITLGQPYILLDTFGRPLLSGKLTSEGTKINISELISGIYFLKADSTSKCNFIVYKFKKYIFRIFII